MHTSCVQEKSARVSEHGMKTTNGDYCMREEGNGQKTDKLTPQE